MRMICEKKSWLYAALAVVLSLALTLPFMHAYAYELVDTEKTCTIAVSVSEQVGGEKSYADDLKTVSIPVRLYRVADITKTAKYEPIDAMEGLDIEKIGHDEAVDAEKLLEIAGQAAVKLGLQDAEGNAAEEYPDADVEFDVENGSTERGGIPTGLYLVWIAPVNTAEYAYTFSPYLVSLPNNTYFTDENDEWNYGPVTVGIKPEREERYGKLEIQKTLNTYNTSLGEAIFVFQVEATKEVDGEKKKVYSNMVTLNFSEPGMRSAVIDQIPAESEVTVKEVYSGAAYEITEGADGYTLKLKAADESDEAQKVAFTNDYNEGNNHGTGIVNHFEYDGNGFAGKQIKDNQK